MSLLLLWKKLKSPVLMSETHSLFKSIVKITLLIHPSPFQILLPSGISTRFCIYIKSMCSVRLRFAVPLGKHFSTLISLIFSILDVELQT